MDVGAISIDGRLASIARRHALSAGKGSLPQGSDRVRNGRRHAVVIVDAEVKTNAADPAQETVVADAPAHAQMSPPSLIDGRGVSIARRRAISQGKHGLVAGAAPASERRPAAAPHVPSSNGTVPGVDRSVSCRDQAKARRSALCRVGRGDAQPSLPNRKPRPDTAEFIPGASRSQNGSAVDVTGLRIAPDAHVTGNVRGAALAVSGTQSIGPQADHLWQPAGSKVGHAHTAGGTLYSGTLVRSKTPITGDEAGSGIRITGEVDGNTEADLREERTSGDMTAAQFARHTNPHGSSIFGTNLGRSATVVGSRERRAARAIELTHAGIPLRGSSIGRSDRVTGDEPYGGVTGDRYCAPARSPMHGGDGKTSPDDARRSALSEQRVTGIDIEKHSSVSGTAAGADASITGTPYQSTDAQLAARSPSIAVTGDTPLHDTSVTGTARGAHRAISGTPYYSEAVSADVVHTEPVAAIDQRFSLPSPQRAAHLRAAREHAGTSPSKRITGSFAIGEDKITGNLEFLFRSRQLSDAASPAARLSVTGEGRAAGRAITGSAWSERSNVGGTEGNIASDRNPTQRAGKPNAFAGARRFKTLASTEDPKHLVTGMFGYSSDNAAKVTLSGGAQG